MGLAAKYVLAEDPIPAPEDQCGHEWDAPTKEGAEPTRQKCLRRRDHREGHSSMTNDAQPGVVAYLSRKIVMAASSVPDTEMH